MATLVHSNSSGRWGCKLGSVEIPFATHSVWRVQGDSATRKVVQLAGNHTPSILCCHDCYLTSQYPARMLIPSGVCMYMYDIYVWRVCAQYEETCAYLLRFLEPSTTHYGAGLLRVFLLIGMDMKCGDAAFRHGFYKDFGDFAVW